jgi:signal transduction histidine kinase
MAGFRAKTGIKEANILLKPFTRVTLAVFLGMAISAPTAASLRADCDTLLQCLIQTNLRLQEYDQDRTNFLARAVHDFRAPLTALSGYCGLLLSEPLGPLTDSQKEVLSRMQRSTGRLSRLASAMFQLSVGRQVKRHLGLQRGDIRACLDQALHEIGPLADEKRISLTAQLEPCEEQVYIDEGQIEQVLINILDNACKFTPRAGSIEIRGYPFSWDHKADHPGELTVRERRSTNSDEPNSYRVDIRDSGTPISPEHLECIFEEYTSYAGRDRSGGGLGLAICRSIINQHEGRVWAENTEAGPRFSFVLPLRQAAPNINGSTERQVVTYTEA